MKRFVKGIGALVVVAFLAACGAAAPDEPAAPDATPAPPAATPAPIAPVDEDWTPAAAGDVTINVSWWGVDARANAYEAAFDVFRARYPNVTINTDWGAFGGHLDNIIIQLGAGTEPDLMQVNYAWVHSLAPDGNNVFLDLNTVSHILDLSEWTDSDLAFMTVGGELAGVPHGMNGRIVVYNRLLMEEFGLPTFPATIEELLAVGEQVSVGNNLNMDLGENRYILSNLDNLLFDLSILTWLYATTGNTLQAEGQMLHTVDQVAAVFDIVGQLQETGTVQNPFQEPGVGNFMNHNDPLWTEGRAGGALVWVSDVQNFMSTFIEEGDQNWGDLGIAPLPLPAGASPVTMQRPSLGHAISRNTQHPEVVAYLLNFLYTDEAAILAIDNTLGVPFSRTAEAVAIANDIILPPQLEGMEILGRAMGIIDEYFEDPRLRNPRLDIFEEFRHGVIDSQTAAQRFVSEQQSALDAVFSP
ncbi:MAG: ABC transporter substrate-binding protein [Clostridiales bacterium]|jgi:oligogalacturonide transport system substrate-binding protein|nr:ABC transporter substrate-binding protein [Clostridiales bacterium]